MKNNGLKRRDIKPCSACGKGLGKGGPIVYRVQIERFVLDPRAIQQQAGLEMTIGVPLASIMGPDPDIATHVDTVQVLVCGDCVCRLPAMALYPEDGEPAAEAG